MFLVSVRGVQLEVFCLGGGGNNLVVYVSFFRWSSDP